MMLTVRRRLRVIVHSAISLVLVACVVVATLTLSTVNALSSSAMSCCPPGSSDHCDAGLMSKPPPPPEPMCGLDTSQENRVDTIIATSTGKQQRSATENNKSSSLKAPCSVDCCSFAQSTFKRPNLDLRGLVTRKAATSSFKHQSSPKNPSVLLLASEGFDKTIPRGPPQVF